MLYITRVGKYTIYVPCELYTLSFIIIPINDKICNLSMKQRVDNDIDTNFNITVMGDSQKDP